MKRKHIYLNGILILISFFGFYGASLANEGSSRGGSQCWQPRIKRDFPSQFDSAIGHILRRREGESAGIDEIISAERKVTASNFGVTSIDRDTGNLVCNAVVKVVFKTRDYGDVVLPGTTVNFEIIQTEKGEKISIFIGNITAFFSDLKQVLESVGIPFSYYIND